MKNPETMSVHEQIETGLRQCIKGESQVKIVELDSKTDSQSPLNQLRQKIGEFAHVVFVQGEAGPSGCARDSKGKCWDWWVGLEGNVVVIPSV